MVSALVCAGACVLSLVVTYVVCVLARVGGCVLSVVVTYVECVYLPVWVSVCYLLL